MPFKIVVLWTDALIYLLLFVSVFFIIWARERNHLREAWRRVIVNRIALVSLLVLSVFLIIGILDSIHFRLALYNNGQSVDMHYSGHLYSLFDLFVKHLWQFQEKTYSAPFALHGYVKEIITQANGSTLRDYPLLQYAGQGIHSIKQETHDIVLRTLLALFISALIALPLFALLILGIAKRNNQSYKQALQNSFQNNCGYPRRLLMITSGILVFIITLITLLALQYHVFGTDKVGQDVLYQTLKSIRTGLVIGTLTTLVMLPLAIVMGTFAGYFGGKLDDVIQYIYTTLSSIPGVLLIAAAILSLQIFIANHSDMFHTLAERADLRLLALCIILGVTSWTGLCRILRAETLKLREIDYVQAAKALGSSHFKIIIRHILPNVMHIILIAVVLDFSMLVLAEAVLSYVGVGVSPTMMSWGNMINSARLELAREPIVWWPITAAFIFMFILVLSANLFADAVRDAFDPRTR